MNRPLPITYKAAAPSSEAPWEPILHRGGKLEYIAGVMVWLATLMFFWSWWFRPEHNIGTAPFLIVSALLAWITLIPLYFIVIFYGSRKPTGPLRIPDDTRVAMVVTKAPSEPFAVVAETLRAMLAQDHPHDTWLADEDPSLETIGWCRDHGVSISTRKGREDYHRMSWPRRTRCKEGNLAFFYDHYGYELYDIVAQLDSDHVPDPDYLREMLKPFADPRIGYVSAPSICDKNAAESWSARGRLYAEASMHGSLQAGYNSGWAPLCIGSHYAVRTAALREIGGLGPELAEDHSTTLMMNASGWRGVHALDAIAHGEGPKTFADLATQEFQWSRSLVMILLQYTPLYLPCLPARLKFQFLFSQLWYPLFALFMAFSFTMPIVALVFKINFVAVTYPDFFFHFAPLSFVLIALAHQWRAGGSSRPFDAKVLSWEMVIFLFARWPWALAGTLAAVRDWTTGTHVDFRVTPKGVSEVDPAPMRVLAPYATLSIASALPALVVADAGPASGFYVFATLNAIVYAITFAVIVVRHARENEVRRGGHFRKPVVAFAFITLFAAPALATTKHGLEGLDSIANGTSYFSLTESTYGVAGAGLGGGGIGKLTFHFRWKIGSQVSE
jgi:cellulose synthase (UDP-forming)